MGCMGCIGSTGSIGAIGPIGSRADRIPFEKRAEVRVGLDLELALFALVRLHVASLLVRDCLSGRRLDDFRDVPAATFHQVVWEVDDGRSEQVDVGPLHQRRHAAKAKPFSTRQCGCRASQTNTSAYQCQARDKDRTPYATRGVGK